MIEAVMRFTGRLTGASLAAAIALVLFTGARPALACTLGEWPTVAEIRAGGGLIVHARLVEMQEPEFGIQEYRLAVLEVLQGEAPDELVLRDLETDACASPLRASPGQEVVLALDVVRRGEHLDPFWAFDADGRVTDSTVAAGRPRQDPSGWIGTERDAILALLRQMPDTATVAPGTAGHSLVATVGIGAAGLIGVVAGLLLTARRRRFGSL